MITQQAITLDNPSPEAVYSAWLTLARAYGGYARVAILSGDGRLAKGLARVAVRAATTYLDLAEVGIR